MEHRMRYSSDSKNKLSPVLAALGLGLVVAYAPLVVGQDPQPKPSLQPQSQSQTAPAGQAQQPNAGQPAAPQGPVITKQEEDAYKAFAALAPDQTAQIIAQGEKFLDDHPTSPYRPVIFARLVFTYSGTGQIDRMYATGDKALAEDPDNIDVLSLLCTLLPVANYDPRSLDADQKLLTAEKYANHVLELAPKLAKPSVMSEEQFATYLKSKTGMAHSGLGRVYYRQGKVADYVREFDKATKTDPSPDPLDYFLLGQGEMSMKDFSDASTAFDQCAKAKWDPQWQGRCKKGEEDAKQAAAAPARP